MKLRDLLKTTVNEAPDPRSLVNVNTPAFRAWFQGSKAVDDEGQPIVFYRGTTKRPGEARFGTKRSAPSFVAVADIASVYASSFDPMGFDTTPSYRTGATVSPVFLSIKNPVDLRDKVNINFEYELFSTMRDDWNNIDALNYVLRIYKALRNFEGKGIAFEYELPSGWLNEYDWDDVIDELEEAIDELSWGDANESLWEKITDLLGGTTVDSYAVVDTQAFRQWAVEKGFDGVVHTDVFTQGKMFAPSLIGHEASGLDEEDYHVTWRPFDATQVKSIYNQGTWSTTPGSSMSEAVYLHTTIDANGKKKSTVNDKPTMAGWKSRKLREEELTERRKLRRPQVMYHGTSDAHLRGILKQGVLPSASEKVWADDPYVSPTDFSRASLEGSYWTSNLMTARSSATNAVNAFGGNDLMVMAQIAEQSAHADEDSINFALQRSLPEMYNELAGAGVTAEAAMKYAALSYFSGGMFDERFGDPQKMLETYARILHGHLAADPDKEPMDLGLMKRMMEAHMWRQLAYLKWSEQGESGFYKDPAVKEMDRLADEGKVPPIPELPETEAEVKRIQDLLTKKYTKTAYKDYGDFAHTLRLTEPVTFRGANKILSIIGEMPNYEVQGYKHQYEAPYILYYGTPPRDFFEQHAERIGSFPGLVNVRGEVVMPPKGRS